MTLKRGWKLFSVLFVHEACVLNIYTRNRIQIAKFFTIYSSFSDIDDCASDPCENNATCTDGVNNYTCACMAGYEGYNCSIGKLDHFPSYSTYE